ncbi:GspE/PulE family protein [Rubellicoccus peritrichatus]|uniref:GspE/PulE family protein n=1 Tax=Rubellicoccus peritrichatus TaxID=3080537 RepID=A0AAQ3L6A4_9BACT|nr:GspE/PulE family protein [Puniceicoccus sp. CR14]WOO39492.1 GspE/PulE family protein [Puniceicoccus sp. CR14]
MPTAHSPTPLPQNTGQETVTKPKVLDLEQIKFDPHWALQTPPSVMIRRRILPLVELDGKLHVAVEKTLDPASAKLLQRLSGFTPVPVIATAESIRSLQTRLFGNLRSASGQDRPIIESSSTRTTGRDGNSEEAISVCDQLLKTGLIRGASDIHFNVQRDGSVQVRLRIDGVLSEEFVLPETLHLALFNRLKVLGGLDISEKRASQDGSFAFEPGGILPRAEIRMATIPARHGERITLRLLIREDNGLTLDRLGFSEQHREQFSRAINLSHGMILITGPTGSGKSTTLYAAIKHLLAQKTVNVMTVEDPVEYEIDGVTQTEVDARREKVSFASSLRSILRHDPDVVMLGEIRDRETAELAVRAALTGHLVLSTLHTNTAVGAVTRLLDLGVDRFLIATVLRLVAAQRLVRELCPHCCTQDRITEAEAMLLHQLNLEGEPCRRANGCLHCAGKGFVGRSGLFEVFPIGRDESHLIGNASSVDSLESQLTELRDSKGNPSLMANGMQQVNTGKTTIEEVIKATADFV